MNQPTDRTSKIPDLIFSFLFLGAGALALAWFFGMAAGFPFGSRPFWTRWLAAPLIVMASISHVVCALLSGKRPRCDAAKRHLQFGAVCFLAAMLVSARLHFPITMRTGLLIVAVLVVLCLLVLVRRIRDLNLAVIWVVFMVAIVLGIYLPRSQRGLDSATSPNNAPVEIVEGDDPADQFIKTEHTTVDLPSKAIAVDNRDATLLVLPLLEFTSCSPDRCWTVFSPRRYFSPPPRLLSHWNQRGATLVGTYNSGDLPVASWSIHHRNDSEIAMDARSNVRQDTFSHLNSFSYLEFAAAGALSLSFSPCGTERIAFTESDYPVGRPARFAYLDSDNLFRVVEASNAEKGPFKELSSGRLDQPFRIKLHAGNDTLFTIEMPDWAPQASTQLSPTAGWGVAENAIEFRRINQRAVIFFTLAGTSVGRGFQSVGHAPGVYQNRVVIKRM